MVWAQGSTLGTDHEFAEMLSFISDYKLAPVVGSVRPFSEALAVLDDLSHSHPHTMGKLVVAFPH